MSRPPPHIPPPLRQWYLSSLSVTDVLVSSAHRRRINTICLHTCDKLLSALPLSTLWVHVDLFFSACCLTHLIASTCRIWESPNLLNLAFVFYFGGPRGSLFELRGEHEVRLKRMDVHNQEVYECVSAGTLRRRPKMKLGAGVDVNTACVCVYTCACVFLVYIQQVNSPQLRRPVHSVDVYAT